MSNPINNIPPAKPIPYHKQLAHCLLKIDETKMNPKLLKKIDKLAKKMMRTAKIKVGEHLHRLEAKEDTEQGIENITEAFPFALSHGNYLGRLPIHSAVWRESVIFVPMLAQLGAKLKLNVGGRGEDKRGGLLMSSDDDEDGDTTLQLLLHLDGDNVDSTHLQVLQKLRQMDFLRKSDITKYDLLCHSCQPYAKKRFEYLLEWYPGALKAFGDDCSLVHAVLKSFYHCSIESFIMALQACLKYYPQHLGFLFKHDFDGKTACQLVIEGFGKEDALNAIAECIPTTSDTDDTAPVVPILHHVIQNAPEYMNDISARYPSAIFVRDDKGRSVHHVALSTGYNYKEHALFFQQMSDEQIEDKDPVTDLYPFVLAASLCDDYDMADVSTIFYLLRRCPSVLDPSRRYCSDGDRKEGPNGQGRSRNGRSGRKRNKRRKQEHADSNASSIVQIV